MTGTSTTGAPRDGELTIGRWLSDRAACSPARIAIDDRGVLLDYATLEARVQRLTHRLTQAGYGAGGRITTISGNSADHVVAFFACARLGMALVPLSWRLTAAELAALLRRTAPDLVLVEDEYAALGRAALALLEDVPPTAGLGTAGAEAEVPSARTVRPTRPVRGEDPLLIIFTSGSEAAPKGVVLTHANCFWNNLALSRALPLTADDVVLALLPQHHVGGWNIQPLLAWWVGATVVLERSFQPDRVLQLVQERRVTAMMGVPTQYRMLFDTPGADAADLGSLRTAVVGGGTVTPELALEAAARGVPLTQGYGLTEGGPNVLHLPHEELRDHPGAVGRPYPTVETQVVDPETRLPLDGEATGELWVRGPSVFPGYLDDEETTARALVDGWLRTGDLVHRTADGIHRIVDRLKNIFVSGGENVAPAEVEAAYASHPLVERVCVVGVPDTVWGERGFAFVVARAPVTEDELRAHARSRLAGFKVPAHHRLVEALPEVGIGKPDRPALRRRAAAELAEAGQSGQPAGASAGEPGAAGETTAERGAR